MHFVALSDHGSAQQPLSKSSAKMNAEANNKRCPIIESAHWCDHEGTFIYSFQTRAFRCYEIDGVVVDRARISFVECYFKIVRVFRREKFCFDLLLSDVYEYYEMRYAEKHLVEIQFLFEFSNFFYQLNHCTYTKRMDIQCHKK